MVRDEVVLRLVDLAPERCVELRDARHPEPRLLDRAADHLVADVVAAHVLHDYDEVLLALDVGVVDAGDPRRGPRRDVAQEDPLAL